MPYVTVHVDADEVLSGLSDDELRQELASRKPKRASAFEPEDPVHAEIRRALEDRDWRALERLAVDLNIFWMRPRAAA